MAEEEILLTNDSFNFKYFLGDISVEAMIRLKWAKIISWLLLDIAISFYSECKQVCAFIQL